MIPTNDPTFKTEGNLHGEKIVMDIDAAATQHLMQILTDLYSDPYKAIAREYPTNAADSHKEAGQTRPIEITTPSALDPNFRVKDWGIGMSPSDIENIFSKYGASTKRQTNTQTGMLGLGCKSALTLVQQFYINAVKNGVRTKTIIYRDEDGRGVMEIVDTSSTDDHNGVEVVIPLQPTKSFENLIEENFKYWSKGSVLVNGKEPQLPEGARWISDEFLIIPDSHNRHNIDHVFMGNVLYPVDSGHSFTPGLYKKYRAVAFVEMASVDFPPNRESLQYNDKTIGKLRGLRARFQDALNACAQREIENAPNATEALKQTMFWKDLCYYSNLKLEYKGQPIQTTFKYNHFTLNLAAPRHQSTNVTTLEARDLFDERFIVVTGWGTARPSRRQKEKIREWLKQNNHSTNYLILLDDLPGSPFTDEVKTADWNVINKTTIPKRAPSSSKTPSEEHEYLNEFGHVMSDEFDFSKIKNLMYFSPSNVERFHYDWIAKNYSDYTIIKLAKHRRDKFERDNPHAISLEFKIKRDYENLLASLTEEDWLRINMDSSTLEMCQGLSNYKIDNPKIQILIDIAQKSVVKFDTLENIYTKMYGFFASNQARGEKSKSKIGFPFRDYPILSRYERNFADVALYLNAKYNEGKAND